MAEGMRKDVDLVEPTKIDTAASDSCTRSGAYALLLSLALFSMIPYWLQVKEDIALNRYLSLRLNLVTAVDLLNDDPTWQKYRTSQKAAESMPMAQLLEVLLEIPLSEANTTTVELKPASTGEDRAQQAVAPVLSPPGGLGLRIGFQIDEIHRIAAFLRGLDDSDLLTTTRGVSNSLNYSIYRWAFKRRLLIIRNIAASIPDWLPWPEHKEAQQHENSVPTIGSENFLKYLTLRDVQELARFELPKAAEITLSEGRMGKQIDITPGSLPRNLYMATASAQVLLLFVIVYFNAFAREAALSGAFPVPGTLFSAFSKSYWTLTVFLLALWSPFLASLSIAVTARKWPFIGLSMLIGFTVVSVHVVFHRKSYFKILYFWQLQRSNHSAKNGVSSDALPSSQNPDLSRALPNKPDAGDA